MPDQQSVCTRRSSDLSTVQKRIMGTEVVGVIYAQPKDPKKMDEAKDQNWQTLMRRYDNLPDLVFRLVHLLAVFRLGIDHRSEEHKSELQSRHYLVCRL